jgi:prepilin-type processing-associated H-X9-DG protein
VNRDPNARRLDPGYGRGRAFALIELMVVIMTLAGCLAIVAPILAQARGDDWAAITRANLRAYAQAHLVYIADYDVLPPIDYSPGSTPAWLTEVGVFSTSHGDLYIDVPLSVQLMMNRFVDNYVDDAMVFTSPADTWVRYTEAGDAGRLGNLLTPSEDPQAVGATFSRLWFADDYSSFAVKPRDFRMDQRWIYVELGGLWDCWELGVLRVDMIQSPSDCVDLVEEDEESILNNSVFTPEAHAWSPPPFEPGTSNVITDRHPGNGGHVSYFDGHVELFDDVVNRYWSCDSAKERTRLLWGTAWLDDDPHGEADMPAPGDRYAK